MLSASPPIEVGKPFPIVMAYPDATIYQLDESGISRVNYKDTEHYNVTRSFLEFPEVALRELFKDRRETESEDTEA